MRDAAISDLGFLADASPALKDLLRSLAKRSSLHRGEVLFEQDDPGETLFALVSGRLEVSLLSSDGRKLGLNILHPGALFGEIALFDPGPRTATITALEPTEVLGVKNTDVLKALRDMPDLHVDMIQLAGKRMRWISDQLSDQVFLSMPTRLARKILHLTADHPGETQTLRMSQTDLAEFVGASREAVSKTLAVWKRDKIIDLSRGGLSVQDRTALKEIAEILIF